MLSRLLLSSRPGHPARAGNATHWRRAAAGGEGGYAGEVANVDHKAYMPAAWRADTYLDGEEEDDLASLRAHK